MTDGTHLPGPGRGRPGTPLAHKLGIGEDDEVAVVGAPDGIADRLAADLADQAVVHADLGGAPLFDVIVAFMTWRSELEGMLDLLRARMAPGCRLWIAWPKRAARVPTDLTDTVIREVSLIAGLVDTKACEIDQTWSGLRLAIRRELRDPGRARRRARRAAPRRTRA